jgi:hypothetical protein
MALPILQIERKFNEINPDSYKTDFVFYGVINTNECQPFHTYSGITISLITVFFHFNTGVGTTSLIVGILLFSKQKQRNRRQT